MKKYFSTYNLVILALIFVSAFIANVSKGDIRFTLIEKVFQSLASPLGGMVIALFLMPIVWIFTQKKTNPERYSIALVVVLILVTIGGFTGK